MMIPRDDICSVYLIKYEHNIGKQWIRDNEPDARVLSVGEDQGKLPVVSLFCPLPPLSPDELQVEFDLGENEITFVDGHMNSISTLPSGSVESIVMFPTEPLSFVGTVTERRLLDVLGR